MENKDLIIPIPYRKYVAIREALEKGGNNFDEQLQAKTEEWYQALVPKEQREEIEKQIQADMKAEELRSKSFAVVCIKDDFESYAFTTENGENFYSLAKNFAELEKDKDFDNYTVDTLGRSGFHWRSSLEEPVYKVLCDAIKINPLISVVAEFDVYERKAWVLEKGTEDWKEYDFDMLAKAVESTKVFSESNYQEQEAHFRAFLQDTEITVEEGQGLTQ